MNDTPYKAIIKYYLDAKTKYGAHSPFLFDFVNNVLIKRHSESIIARIEEERRLLNRNHNLISFVEYGAGSKSVGDSDNSRKISDVSKSSLSGPWQCNLIYNLISHYQPKSILEIGTSFGVSTSYLAGANPTAKVTTLEGNPSSAEIAQGVFSALNLTNVKLNVGEFSKTLVPTLNDMGTVSAAFIDGNHREDATIEYFNSLMSYTNKHSIIIVDDIYWSQGMNAAWEHIKAQDSVAFSIDLFRMGIVFLDQSIMPKQHFKLIDFKYKPYSIGLFG